MCLFRWHTIKKTKKTKKNCIYHVLKRFDERFGKKYTVKDINNINTIIVENNTEFINNTIKQSCTKTIFDITYDNNNYLCVYNKQLHTIVTVLHPEWVYNLNNMRELND